MPPGVPERSLGHRRLGCRPVWSGRPHRPWAHKPQVLESGIQGFPEPRARRMGSRAALSPGAPGVFPPVHLPRQPSLPQLMGVFLPPSQVGGTTQGS